MAFDKVVDSAKLDSGLTSIADSIRAKSKTTESLTFPEGFKSAVDSIKNVGIILSDFTHLKDGNIISNMYPLPTVADMRSLPYNYSDNWNYENMFNYSFWNCSRSAKNGYYTELHTIYLPDWITGFGQNMFQYCGNLVNLIGDLSNVIRVYSQAFFGCASLPELPYMPNLTRIDNQACKNCKAFTKLVLPPKLTYFEQNVFWQCTGLTEVTFQCIPTTLPGNVFNECTNLTDIYCPWAEGEVANAPWGATNATIHYNTQFDENGNPITE